MGHHDRPIKRSLALGRLISIAGGSPTGPIVILTGDVLWSLRPDAQYGRDMIAQHLSITSGWMAPGDDLDAALAQLKTDLEGAKARLVTTDVTQSQTLGLRVEQTLRPSRTGWAADRDVGLRMEYSRLVARPIAPDQRLTTTEPRGPREISLGELPGQFNDIVSRVATDKLHNYPIDRSGPDGGRTVIDVDQMAEGDAPFLSANHLREALTTVSTLRPPQFRVGSEDDQISDLGLGAVETVAAALALMVVCARECAPASTSRPNDPWGWGPMTGSRWVGFT